MGGLRADDTNDLALHPSSGGCHIKKKKRKSIQIAQRKSLQVGQGKAVLFFPKNILGGFPGSSVVNNPPANTGDTDSIPGLGRSHMLWSN